MFIDKSSKSLLKKLINSEPDFPRRVFSYEHICDISGIDEDSMFPLIKNLESLGLIEFAYWDNETDMGIVLTQKGIAHKELCRLEARARWSERLIGFVLGVGATVLAWLITTAIG